MTPWQFRTVVARGEATSVRELPGGFVCTNVDYPASHVHNAAWLTAGAPPPDVRMAEYGAPPPTVGGGWRVQPLVVMAGRSSGEVVADVVAPGGLHDAQVAQWRDEHPDLAHHELVQLADRQLATARACTLTNHVAYADGEPAAWCELRRIGDVAQIENVVTRTHLYGAGHGTRVVNSALAAAGSAFLVADADDWPREWYRRLGFVEVGAAWTLSRS